MEPRDFTYWLQGFAELNPEPPTADQWQVIKDHLALVFKKETPTYVFQTPLGTGPLKWSFDSEPVVTC